MQAIGPQGCFIGHLHDVTEGDVVVKFIFASYADHVYAVDVDGDAMVIRS